MVGSAVVAGCEVVEQVAVVDILAVGEAVGLEEVQIAMLQVVGVVLTTLEATKITKQE